MFYSQFILAKKGPLGTIWIAAHLERKLRKNQVADTDIGVSVDSILCPEVPIALRLSSHLLLGVVRIYSRKVNYLFDDCSEALLKIKQAFRSTAVDLPPEESKAPYHSITLPETFDLDDFELPENDIFQGNYVDHHTSTREQITLQDNMDGVVFSTSQFGLDERFGDGEAPGLNLDEELFLQKVDNAGHAGESADHQSSSQAATPKPDEGYGGILSNRETRIGNLNLEGDLMDYAQAPCTPGLVETPNLAIIQEISAYEDHMDDEDNPLTEPLVNGNSENISSKFSHCEENAPVVVLSSTDNKNSIAAVDMPSVENVNHLSDLETEKRHSPLADGSLHISSSDPLSPSGKSFAVAHETQALGQDPKLTGMTTSGTTCLVTTHELENVILKNDDVNHPSVSNKDHVDLNGIISKESFGDASCSISSLQVPEDISDDHQTAPFGEKSKDMEVSGSPGRPIFSNGKLGSSVEDQCLSSLEMPGDNGMSIVAICDEMQFTQVHILKPCSTGLELPDSSVPRVVVSNDLDTATDVGAVPLESSGGGEMIHASGPANLIQDDKLEHDLMGNHSMEPVSVEDSHAVAVKSDNQVNNVVGGDDVLENVSSPVNAAFPAPEKLLSVPDEHDNQPRDLPLEATLEDLACVDESDAGSRIISGKKRSYTESTLTEQSLYSVESERIVRIKRTAEAIPDDDDLLSSILVGRRSSVLKVKPTPPPYEITSVKRKRQAPRASASKRKVLMDDTMVLHGDTIREQLTTTEDIRRLRKKAPCTHPEMFFIMKQFLEEEIFSEPLFSGASVALASLFNKGYDLSRIKISKGDADALPLLSSSDMKSISAIETVENATDCATAVTVENDVGDCGEKLDENRELCAGPSITEREINPKEKKEEAMDPSISLHSPPQNFGENEIGDTSAPSEAVGIAQLTTPNEGVDSDALMEMESTIASSGDIREAQNVTLDASVVRFDTVKSGSTDAATEVEPKANDVFVLEGTLCADTVETERYVGEQVQSDACGPSGESDEKQAEACGPSGENEQLQAEACGPSGENELLQAEACGPSGENEQVRPEACVPSGENEQVQSEVCGPSVENAQVQSEACGPSCEIEADTSRRDYSEPLFGGSSGGTPVVASLYPSESGSVQGSFLNDHEYLIHHEGYPSNAVGAEIDMQDYNDFNYSAAANDTEFLNVDDDEVAEVTDDYVPDADETRFMEKSGWSSRTRAVANYLQTMFLKEAEYDRKLLPMDNLLSGKTRKEASRMFFETLVLKTKDYIHVEQERPHQNINIKPKMKLLKTEF